MLSVWKILVLEYLFKEVCIGYNFNDSVNGSFHARVLICLLSNMISIVSLSGVKFR